MLNHAGITSNTDTDTGVFGNEQLSLLYRMVPVYKLRKRVRKTLSQRFEADGREIRCF